MLRPRFAIMLDGGFVTKVLSARLQRYPKAEDIIAECDRVSHHPTLAEYELLRIYYYDAPPAGAKLTNPIDGSRINLKETDRYKEATELHTHLATAPNFALRMGDTMVRGWQIGEKSFKKMSRRPRALAAGDLIPNIKQKGVDLRIGLDMARLALRESVRAVVVMTGDSDLIPAFKFARREGMRVYLDHLGRNVRPGLRIHADIVFEDAVEHG